MTASDLPADDLGREWAARRGTRALIHVDTAACGRTSTAVRDRITTHLAAESDAGGYLAEAEAAAELDRAREHLAGLLGFDGQDLAFVESASAALAQLIDAWPLRAGQTVWALRSEWGPNLAAFADRGLHVDWLATDDNGVLDIEALEARLRTTRPSALLLTSAASHRALLQPVAAAVALCEPFGIPVIVDVAQAVGQVEIEPGAAAVYGTGRKWLCGPRGVGFLAVRDPWQSRLRPVAPALSLANWPVGERRPVRRLASREAYAAGRLGLGVAVTEYVELGPERIRQRLHAIAVALRTALADLPAWTLRDPIDAPGAMVVLAPRSPDRNVPTARAQLLAAGVLTTACQRHRAPHDIAETLLRISAHVELTAEDIDTIAKRLREIG